MKSFLPAMAVLYIAMSFTSKSAVISTSDTLKVYRLGEIVATGDKDKANVLISTSDIINYRTIQQSDAISLTELAAYIPTAKISTNSRGEALIYLRGAGERHLGLFLDGALINVPWDNRMDMSMLPTDIIANIQINKGSNSVLYGANILSGAINISTIERATEGMGATVRIQGGDAGTQLFSFTNDGRYGIFNWVANVSYEKSDGIILSGNAPDSIPNQAKISRLRTNSDQKRLSSYFRTEFKLSESTTLGLSLNNTNSEKGVAPETSVDTKKARKWRYPDWNRNLITFNGEHVFSKENQFVLKASIWYDLFKQTIDNYTTLAYDKISDSQKDDDRTIGSRFSLQYMFLPDQYIILAFNGLMSDHDMTNIKSPTETTTYFSQDIYSSGAEYRGKFGDLNLSAGLAYDYMKSPQTLSSTASNTTFDAIGAFFGARYDLSKEMNIFGSVSKKTRFPSLRESFDDGLGKFIINPDLRPETGTLTEMGIAYKTEGFSSQLTAFGNFYKDLIAKVGVKGDSLGRSMRVNYSEGTILGVELLLGYQPISRLNLDGAFSIMSSKGKDNGKAVDSLEYKPAYTGLVGISYSLPYGITPRIECELMGTQYGLNPKSSILETIDPYVLLNARIGYTLPPVAGIVNEIFVRVNNIADIYYMGQIGLPMPGRMFYAGIVARI